MQANTTITIVVGINLPSVAFTTFAGPLVSLDVPGAAYAVAAPALAAAGGGGADNARAGAWILLGRWAPPLIAISAKGSIQVRIGSRFMATAPLLSVQTLYIKIEAAHALVESLLKRVDFDTLRALLPREIPSVP